MHKNRIGFLSQVIGIYTVTMLMGLSSTAFAGGSSQYGEEDPNKKVLKSGLMGAVTGGIAASASGGKAGTGALVGAGTNVIGGALLDSRP